MATAAMNESWRRFKGQIEKIWDDVDFDSKEMKRARGSLERMINLIHEETGESRDEIRRKMAAVI